MTDAYHHIYDGEIFKKSQCIWHENTLMDFLRSNLVLRGYQAEDATNKVWRREQKRVVICLVDDFTTCSGIRDPYVPALWDRHTTVLTDNSVTCPTQYKVKQLPESFFGIYAYDSEPRAWQPDRRFNFSVNRIDSRRMALLLEYRKRLPWEPDRDVMDYANFNCWRWHGDNSSPEGFRQNFEVEYTALDQVVKDVHQITKDTDVPEMPWRNHDLDLEHSMHRAWINMVVETYSGEAVIALSEKTFRALVTPVPWQIYAGRYSVAYLEQLGFDCVIDLVDHVYDSIPELKTMDYGDKLVEWWWAGSNNHAKLLQQDFAVIQARCQQAAKHNLDRLKKMQQDWPQDLAAWWWSVSQDL